MSLNVNGLYTPSPSSPFDNDTKMAAVAIPQKPHVFPLLCSETEKAYWNRKPWTKRNTSPLEDVALKALLHTTYVTFSPWRTVNYSTLNMTTCALYARIIMHQINTFMYIIIIITILLHFWVHSICYIHNKDRLRWGVDHLMFSLPERFYRSCTQTQAVGFQSQKCEFLQALYFIIKKKAIPQNHFLPLSGYEETRLRCLQNTELANLHIITSFFWHHLKTQLQ